jgi:uncharacterized protein DUF1161
MKPFATIGFLLFMGLCAQAQAAGRPCEDLKTEIAGKLDAKGVKSYTLDIVAKDKDAEGKEVGTCEGGSKKIMYRRGAAAPEAAAPEATKP